ncbi:hypothetical protein [Micromonospora sp. WMMD708]|uniref:hypothetical protein n=1 Tax=Micromonospora sp. WMMD708 TaxID=3403464 RepID=UPI003BF496ED
MAGRAPSRSRIGVSTRPNSSTTASRKPAAAMIRRSRAMLGVSAPASIRPTVPWCTPAQRASSR